MTAADYSVSLVDTAAEIPAQLWAECFPPPLEGKWWYEILERSALEDQFTFFYAVLHVDGNPSGIAPAFLMDVPIELVVPPVILPAFRFAGKIIPSILFERTLFIGSPCSDEGTVGLLPGVDRERAFAGFQQAFQELARDLKAPMLVWKDFPGSYADDFKILTAKNGLFRLVSFPGAVAEFHSKSKDDYYKNMKASRRQKMKRKLRRSAELADLDAEIVQRPGDSTLQEMFALFGQTYEKAATKFERLPLAFFQRAAALDISHFVVLREKATGNMAAFMLCFDVGGVLINKFIGIDYSKPKEWVLYFRLWDAVVDWALSREFSAIQSGQTGYSAKIEIGHRLVPLTNYCRHRNPVVQAIYKAVAKTVDWHTLDPDLASYLKVHPELKAPPSTGKEPEGAASNISYPKAAA